MSVHDDAIAAYLGAIRFGANYLDSKSNHHGTLEGAPTWEDSAELGRRYLRINTPHNDYANVVFADNPAPQSFTVHLWARVHWLAGGNVNGAILVTTPPTAPPHSSGGLFLVAGVMTESSFQLGVRLGSGTYLYNTATSPYNTWMSVGAYYNHATSRVGLYLNGVNVLDQPALSAPVFTNLLVARGGNNSTTTKRVDTADVSLWNRILTPAEFATLAKPSYTPLGTGRRGFPLSRLVN